MKKFFIAVGALICIAGAIRAGSVVYNQNLVNETALAVNTSYTLDLGASQLRASNVEQVSAQAVYAQAAPGTVTFQDGVASTATVTVSSMSALRGTRATNTLTVGSNAGIDGTVGSVQVNVASNTYLAANNVDLYLDGNIITSNANYTVASSSISTAVALAAAIDRLPGFDATSSGSTVTVTCTSVGVYCNSKPVSSSAATRLVASGSTLSGGVDNISFTLNGIKMTQGIQFNIGASSASTGQNITDAINGYTPLSSLFIASTASNTVPGVVTITVISSGTLGNSYTLTSSSNAVLTPGGATFSGGVDRGLLIFNLTALSTASVTLTEGIDFQAITSSQATLATIKTAIDANGVLSNYISISTATGAVGTLTAKATGLNYNFGIMTSTPAALTISNKRMYGGVDSDIVTASNSVYEASHGITTGLALLYTKTAGTSPGVLVAGTTYYGIRVDANYFKVASSTTNAVLGTAVSIGTQTATGGGTFVFTPIAYSGTASFKWQASNDNTNWFDLSVTSITYSSPSTTASTTFWDFAAVNFRYLRLNVIASTRGGLSLVVPILGRNDD